MIEVLSEKALSEQLKRDTERVVLKPALYARVERTTSAPNRSRSRVLAAATLAVLAAIVALGAWSMTGDGAVRPAASLPEPDVHIVDPSPGLDPRLAAFSGAWEGIWDGVLPSRLIVERIDRKTAQVVYVWGKGRGQSLEPGWRRFTAGVVGGGRIEWGRSTPALTAKNSPCDAHGDPCSTLRFVFTMHSDLQTIDGRRDITLDVGSAVNTVVMRRVELSRGGGKVVPLASLVAVVAALVGGAVFVRRRRIA